VLMELFKILDEVMYPLRVEELYRVSSIQSIKSKQTELLSTHLSDDLRRLSRINCTNVLHHGPVVISLLIEVVAKLAVNEALLLPFHAGILRQLDSQRKHIPLIEHF
jgi:hypothetical protein